MGKMAMSELPKGWAIATLGEVCTNPQYGWTSKASQSGELKYLRTSDISSGQIDWETVPFCVEIPDDTPKYKIQKDDILVSRAGSVGISYRVSKVPYDVIFASYLIRFKPLDGIEAGYIESYLKSDGYWKSIFDFTAGIAIPNVNATKLAALEIPLPPLNEQRRIVAKLEKLLHRVDACKERLEKIPAILKRFRQSILAAACAGRLTADWREKNQSHNITEDSELPIDWYWKTAEELFPKGGIFDGPFGSNLKTVDYTDSGVRVIRLENIGHLRFIGEKETYISKEKYKTLTRHTVGAGDIIFASFIEEEVRACVLPEFPTKAVAKADCFCLRPYSKLVDKRYLAFQLVSRESYDRLIDSVHGATRPRINTTQLRKLEIRMCPLPEQYEIVRRVEALFKKANEIEVRYKKAKAFVDRLTQSILAKAFRGELVPQDPNDEPALVLLERIKVERAKQEPKRRGKKVAHDA
jgi:type I restriction enzyme S subunit